MRNKKHRHIRRADGIKAAFVLAVMAVVLVGGYWGLDRWQQNRASAVSQEIQHTQSGDGSITYLGEKYIPRSGLKTYLFMGIDVEGPATGNKSYIGGGQADWQMVLVLDDVNQTWQVLQIDRDSMVDVQVLGLTGEVIRTETAQICTAHAYGDGTQRSCLNAATAVSTMLGGVALDGYMAVNMDVVAILNDMVGGVTVTITSDFAKVDPSLIEGEQVTLQGKQALTFVRTRKDVDDETNRSRMERQRQYLAALKTKLEEKDEEFILLAYDAVFDYVVTNMGSGTLEDLVGKMKEYEELPSLTIRGENRTDSTGSNAYYLDEESLQETILTLFYQRG